jgi:hypothetical protein
MVQARIGTVILASLLLASATQAGGPAPVRRTVLHFGEDDIRGDLTRPDGELVQAPRKVTQPSLLRVRKSFVDRALTAPR